MVDIAISTVIAKTEKLEQRPVSPKISKKKAADWAGLTK
jgi:hypothetical protein